MYNLIDNFLGGGIYYPLVFIAFVFSSYLVFKGYLNKFIFLYLTSGLLLEFSIIIDRNWFYAQNNVVLVFVYFALILIFLSLFYWQNLESNKMKRLYSFIYLIMIPLIAFSIYDNGSMIKHNILFIELICLNIVILSLLFFIDILLLNKIVPINQFASFWSVVGLFFWSLFYIFKIGATYYFNSNDIEFLWSLAILFRVFNIITYGIIIYSLFCVIKINTQCQLNCQKLL